MASPLLRQIAEGLYAVDSTFTVWGCRGSVRMSVIKTSAGLVLYSPVEMDAGVIAQIERLGQVAIIIAPNLYHHMFLRAACAAFPEARVLVPSGLEDKIGAVPGVEAVVVGRDPKLPDDLDHFVFSGHWIRETSLFHVPSRTLITADLIYNCQREQYRAEKIFFGMLGLYGRPGLPFYHRFAIENKASVRRLIEKVRSWPVRRIVPCHGRIIENDDAGEIFVSAWRRLA